MRDRARQFGIVGWVVLALVAGTAWGQGRFETQVKTVKVIDANGVPVPDARVYQGECLVWDSQAQTVRLTNEKSWQHTDADGTFSFEFVRQGSGRSYYITDAAFEHMACFYIARKDPNESYTVQLKKPARLKGVVISDEVPFSAIHIGLYYHRPERRSAWGLFSGDYSLDVPMHEMPFDILCPAGCCFILDAEPEGTGIRDSVRRAELGRLEPGQVLDIGALELRTISGFKAFGQPAAELQVSEWVKGEPLTLAELRGKVVLLDFWGLWCSPCRKAMPKLVALHGKYARDGLVIIAIHDASLTKEALLDPNQSSLDLSGLPFRVAIDATPQTDTRGNRFGQGVTIGAYGINSFPTLILIDQNGQVVPEASEEQIHLLLYGRPLRKPTTALGRLIAAHHALFVRIAAVTGLILLLGLILGTLWLRRSRLDVRRP